MHTGETTVTEREMEDLLWNYSERLLGEPLSQFRRQPAFDVGRPDLIFETRAGQLLIVEIKKGTVEREVIGQVLDYFGALKQEFPQRSIEVMVIANFVPPERRKALEHLNVGWREIPLKQFRTVARAAGYRIESEKSLHGGGDLGDFGAVEVDYREGDGFCDPGKWLAVITDIDEHQLVLRYFYDAADPETVTLRQESNGNWWDVDYDVPVSVDFQPSPEKIKILSHRVESSTAGRASQQRPSSSTQRKR
jgi:hypothetical protein